MTNGSKKMKLGIISDTHDNVPMITKAVEFFNNANVDAVMHAGDYVSPFSLKPVKQFTSGRIKYLVKRRESTPPSKPITKVER